jgi:hypothetical protein
VINPKLVIANFCMTLHISMVIKNLLKLITYKSTMYNMNTTRLICIVNNTNLDPLNFWEVFSLVRLHQFENANLVGFSASPYNAL